MGPLALAGIGAGVGVIQSIVGGVGLSKLDRPTYQIADAAKRSLAVAQARKNRNMPGFDNQKENINAATGNAVSLAKQSGNPLLAISSIQENENNANMNLVARNEEYRDRVETQYSNALLNFAQYQDQQWQMNEFAPYADKFNMYNDLLGAGIKNITGGIGDMGSIALSKSLLS